MAHTPQAPQGNAVSKNLTVAQKQWLDGVIACMKQQINTELEPDNDARTPLEKVIADDHALKNMHYRYDGVMQEAEFMQLGSSQMPDFYALWVARRAELGRGPPLKKEQTTAYELAIATGEILTSNKD
ncbi:hypothetical protein MJO28_001765 [Puccinia striiformis f. sp. tritici]|uniref:Uncharacterized protein n=3 Tax=Puccinia striiformis TaxID=27350 RepID=A0A2S4UVX5_9BASI|nr:hypothetical protein MJO28_001765 [Puccinia striiformis f. sp. tritici]KAI7966060.1 hypothetical protein MJO29_001808 [Puccinia striiformis f. sp. tritici]KAI9629728.1 hypothetical protein KEM48_012638 [Puccinia striiformis f. sp. tritici PST-130]POW01432.1 hypothetical protein PSHT_12557 [Puccinia striiformis]